MTPSDLDSPVPTDAQADAAPVLVTPLRRAGAGAAAGAPAADDARVNLLDLTPAEAEGVLREFAVRHDLPG